MYVRQTHKKMRIGLTDWLFVSYKKYNMLNKYNSVSVPRTADSIVDSTSMLTIAIYIRVSTMLIYQHT